MVARIQNLWRNDAPESILRAYSAQHLSQFLQGLWNDQQIRLKDKLLVLSRHLPVHK